MKRHILLVMLVLAWPLPGESDTCDKVPFFDLCERPPLVRISPQYPSDAADDGIEGFTVLRVHVDVSGSVSETMVVEGQPPGVFDQASIRAVRGWKYNPLIIDGQGQAFCTVVRLEFRLTNDPPVDPCSDAIFNDGFEVNNGL